MEANVLQLPVLIGVLVGLGVIALSLGLLQRLQTGDTVTERLTQVRMEQIASLEALELEQPFISRVIKPGIRAWIRRLGLMMPQRNVMQVQGSLERAGRPHNLTVSDFLGLRLIAAIGVAILVMVILYFRGFSLIRLLLLGIGASFGGSLLPSYWLRQKGKARQSEIQRGLPDALDMLTIAVTAGLGLDSAMQTIAEKWDNAVAQEFEQTVREMQVGVPRTEALRAMAQRNAVKEMSNFIAVLVQADQLGLTISNVLKTQSDQMRLMRRQRAEELANKAPIKMLFPLVFLIFPAIFAVVLGPAVPRMLSLFDTL
jgi:tight adherence protein C